MLVRRWGELAPSRQFVSDARRDAAVSYRQLRQITCSVAGYCDRRQIEPGAVVMLAVADPVTFAAVFVAVIASGRTAQPLDPAAPIEQVRRYGPATLVTDRAELLAQLPYAVAVRDLLRSSAGATHVSSETVHMAGTLGGLRLTTSGSTGNPKTVELAEAQLLHVAQAVASHNRLSPEDRGYCPLPLFHINAEVVGLLATLCAGAELVLDRRFHRTGFWELIHDHAITWINAVPAIYSILAREPIPSTGLRLRFVRSASASLPVAIRDIITGSLAVPMIESYGMTEAASQITATSLTETAPSGSVGRPIGAELHIRDEQGGQVPCGVTGQVWIRGAGVITSYLGDLQAHRFDAQGWLDTGDLGYVDEAGYVFLNGRADDVINRGGELVYPREIVEVIQRDPRVREVAVVGRPDEILGAVPVALIIAVEGLTQQNYEQLQGDLLLRCERQLSRFQQPSDLLIVADLPRAATGKIRTSAVRELVQCMA